jgi:hypothetical protein
MYSIRDIIQQGTITSEVIAIHHDLNQYTLKVVDSTNPRDIGYEYTRSYDFAHKHYDKINSFKHKINKLNV